MKLLLITLLISFSLHSEEAPLMLQRKYIDRDGDKIEVLDLKVREVEKELANKKASNIYDKVQDVPAPKVAPRRSKINSQQKTPPNRKMIQTGVLPKAELKKVKTLEEINNKKDIKKPIMRKVAPPSKAPVKVHPTSGKGQLAPKQLPRLQGQKPLLKKVPLQNKKGLPSKPPMKKIIKKSN